MTTTTELLTKLDDLAARLPVGGALSDELNDLTLITHNLTAAAAATEVDLVTVVRILLVHARTDDRLRLERIIARLATTTATAAATTTPPAA